MNIYSIKNCKFQNYQQVQLRYGLIYKQGTIHIELCSIPIMKNTVFQDFCQQILKTVKNYYSLDSNQNPTKNPNQMEIISPNYGGGHRVQGLPVAFATSSNQPDRPNVIYQTDHNYQNNQNNPIQYNNNPCVKASDNPPIYIPAPQVTTTTTSRNSNDRKMVRIIIEMPESMTRNIDEASRYAATQVQRLKVDEHTSKPRRKIKKNIHEVVRKVVQTEEDNEDQDEESTHTSETSAEDMEDVEASDQNTGNPDVIYTKTETNDDNSGKKYIIVRKSGRLRGRSGQRQDENLKAINKYKKIVKVYRD